MAVASTTLNGSMAAIADFRAIGSWIKGRLVAQGWVQGAQAGQVDWTTVATVPSATGTVYEVWTPGDALASFFLRLDYYAPSNTLNINVRVGIALNASHVPTGTNAASVVVSCGSAAANLLSIMSGTSSRATMSIFNNGSVAGGVVTVERTRDDAGAETGDAILLIGNIGVGTAQTQYVPISVSSVPPPAHSPTFALPSAPSTALTFNNDAPVSPLFVFNGKAIPPPIGLMGSLSADFAAASTQAVEVYGLSRTYYMLASINVLSSGSNGRQMILYE